ncbi:MAG: AMP-binding protein [Rhodospirillales bacterium]|nr:AMP-binding protein [Rhodospirillales bacterium]MCW9003146.1 AMP-binding protein [Rhodospirillales bacterium]
MTGIPESTFLRDLESNARVYADRAALICGDERLNWSELDQRINRVANALLSMGVKPGDTVSILSRNSNAYVETFLGILRMGGCVVPLPSMAAPEALERMIVDSGVKVLLLAENLSDLAAPFVDRLDGLLPGGRIALDFDREGWVRYGAWRDSASDISPDVDVRENALFNIIYSSGTTGVPKGIVHDHALRDVQVERLKRFGLDETAISLLSTPIYSNTTLVTLLPTLAAGGCCVLMPKFDVSGFLALCERERVTHTMLVPVQYHRIMADPDFDRYDLSSMRMKLSTSAPLRASLKRDIAARFPGKMVEIYGLTEGGGNTILSVTEFPDKLGSVGRPGEGVEIRIIDEDGVELPLGKVGEIVGRSGTMMRGYHGRPDLTEAMIWRAPDGAVFFRSGDMGRFDEDGFLFLSDRKKDMIISGGLNIYADDLEKALLEHEAVDDVAVIGVPSDQWGETPVGLVVLKPGMGDVSAEVICDWANERLGKSQRLSCIEVRESLPRSSIGKILKRELRAPYWEGFDTNN